MLMSVSFVFGPTVINQGHYVVMGWEPTPGAYRLSGGYTSENNGPLLLDFIIIH